MKLSNLVLIIILVSFNAAAQFPPQYPLDGHNAISRTDDRITGWATACTVNRGYLDIALPDLGVATNGSPENAAGPANGLLVSLGDGGEAILEFAHSIRNGEGPDFVVFENAFANPENEEEAFLELAHVEVSSDGIHYFRFPSVCHFQVDTQHGNFTYTKADQIHNLAGKYLSNWGTPFDLEDLEGTAGLDIDNITHVKIIDVVGSIDPEYANYDSEGNMINDPYPTPYPTGGFDLDAVGVLHSNAPNSLEDIYTRNTLKIYPNPSSTYIYVETDATPSEPMEINIFNTAGIKVNTSPLYIFPGRPHLKIDISEWPQGTYFIESGHIIYNTFIKN